MRNTSFRWIVPVALLLVAVPVIGSAQGSPLSGTWTLNVAKSKYDPGPAPQSNKVTYTITADAFKVMARGVGADGKPTAIDVDAKMDGKEYPVKGAADYDAVVISRIDDNTYHASRRKGGKEVQTGHYVVAKDGKSLTLTAAGTNAAGKTINNVSVFDKQ
jgi:hypothetical protein